MNEKSEQFDRTGKLGYSPTEICELYDQHPDLTLAELAAITMRSVPELKRILTGGSR